MARGGMRPTAPQNNPMNVNGRGGNGQSGTQAARYVSGLPYGEGQALMATQEEEKVDTEDLRDAMKQAIASYAQAIPALASQGQNPSDILYKLSTVINERQKGTPIEKAVSEAFQPQNPPPGAMTPEGIVSPDMLGQPGAVPPGEGQIPEGLSYLRSAMRLQRSAFFFSSKRICFNMSINFIIYQY